MQRLLSYRFKQIPNIESIGPGAPNPYLPSRPAGGAGAPAPVTVNSPAEAEKLAPGTPYRTPDGTQYVR
jgi:hypothetical protein